jgi:ribosomal protein S18 acetylase RimI-like enzyme
MSSPTAGASPRRPRDEPLLISRLHSTDVDACARIVAGDPLWRRYGITLARARTSIRRALGAGRGDRAPGFFAVARHAGSVAGFVWFRSEGTFDHSGYIRWIGVAPDARSRGIGALLMRYAEDKIFQSGPNVFLMVSDFNRRAQAFYRRQGYTKIGVVRDYVVPGITEYLYRKSRGPIDAAGGGRGSQRRTRALRARTGQS